MHYSFSHGCETDFNDSSSLLPLYCHHHHHHCYKTLSEILRLLSNLIHMWLQEHQFDCICIKREMTTVLPTTSEVKKDCSTSSDHCYVLA